MPIAAIIAAFVFVIPAALAADEPSAPVASPASTEPVTADEQLKMRHAAHALLQLQADYMAIYTQAQTAPARQPAPPLPPQDPQPPQQPQPKPLAEINAFGVATEFTPNKALCDAFLHDIEHSNAYLAAEEAAIIRQELQTNPPRMLQRGNPDKHDTRLVIGPELNSPPLTPTSNVIVFNRSHYTVLRPAAEGEVQREGEVRFIAQDVPNAAPHGYVQAEPKVPSDGHCLIGAYYAYRHGVLPPAAEIWRIRGVIAAALRKTPDRVTAAVRQAMWDISGSAIYFNWQDLRFTSYGPQVSAILRADASFTRAYQGAEARRQRLDSAMVAKAIAEADAEEAARAAAADPKRRQQEEEDAAYARSLAAEEADETEEVDSSSSSSSSSSSRATPKRGSGRGRGRGAKSTPPVMQRDWTKNYRYYR